MIKKSIILITLILVFGFQGCATTKNPEAGAVANKESKRESVEELLNLVDAKSVINTVYSQMDQVFKGMGQQLGVKPSEQEVFDKFMSKVASMMKEEMNWDKMKDQMINIYLKHYSEKEIQDQITFYKSDSGQSMIKKQPAVLKDTMMFSQNLVKNFIPKLQKISQELEAELKASRNN